MWRTDGVGNPFARNTLSVRSPPARRIPRASESHLSPDFLAAELELVLFGLEALDFDRYTDPKQTHRSGRKTRLSREQRERVWQALEALYESESDFLCHIGLAGAQAKACMRLHGSDFDSVHFIRRRIRTYLHNEPQLGAGRQIGLRESYRGLTHVFVDEAQDMTRADLRLLAHTGPRPQRLFVAGDSAQALHTGGTSPRPQITGARWRRLALSGSYRLPSLVCKALTPLARQVVELQPVSGDASGPHGVIPEMRRSAVPGPRPVVVNGERTDAMVRAMLTMSRFAGGAGNEWTVVREYGPPDGTLDDLEAAGVLHKTVSLLKVKGLEFPLLLFPTNTTPPKDETGAEWLYTALTRAASVMMIAVRRPTNDSVARALAVLDPDLLMFWDDDARIAWDQQMT